MNRASSATGWVRNPIMKSPDLDPTQASSYDLGWTSNPITGCLNGCPYCYARKLANGRLKLRYWRNFEIALPHENPKLAFDDPFYPRFWEERIKDIQRGYHYTDWSGACAHGASIKGIFVCDMSDLFGIGIPEKWTRKVLGAISKNTVDRFYLLTKQPQNLAKFSPFPPNVYPGVSATDETMFYEACIKLKSIKAKVKYISLEPLLSYDPKPTLDKTFWTYQWLLEGGISWLIIGQQTPIRPETTPKLEWIEEIEIAARKIGIPIFEKNNLKPLLQRELRQEMPGALWHQVARSRRMTRTARQVVDDTITHKAFLQQVIDLAHLYGWRCAHFRPARTKDGWRTPVSADGKGYSDLTMVRGNRLIFVELKTKRDKPSPAQAGWLKALGEVENVEVYLWRPSDWEEIEKVLGQVNTDDS